MLTLLRWQLGMGKDEDMVLCFHPSRRLDIKTVNVKGGRKRLIWERTKDKKEISTEILQNFHRYGKGRNAHVCVYGKETSMDLLGEVESGQTSADINNLLSQTLDAGKSWHTESENNWKENAETIILVATLFILIVVAVLVWQSNAAIEQLLELGIAI